MIWQVDKVASNRRLLATGAAALLGRRVFYATYDGFYVYDNAQEHPIGSNRVDDFLRTCLDESNKDKIYTFNLPTDSEIWVCYAVGSEKPNAAFVYNYFDDTWAHLGSLPGIHFEGYISPTGNLPRAFLPTVSGIAAISPTWSGFDPRITFESSLFADRRTEPTSALVFAFDEENRIGAATGISGSVTVGTNWFEIKQNSDMRQFIEWVRPFTDANDINITVSLTENPLSTEIYTVNISNQYAPTGNIWVGASGRYARFDFRLDFWNYFQGFDIELQKDGYQ